MVKIRPTYQALKARVDAGEGVEAAEEIRNYVRYCEEQVPLQQCRSEAVRWEDRARTARNLEVTIRGLAGLLPKGDAHVTHRRTLRQALDLLREVQGAGTLRGGRLGTLSAAWRCSDPVVSDYARALWRSGLAEIHYKEQCEDAAGWGGEAPEAPAPAPPDLGYVLGIKV